MSIDFWSADREHAVARDDDGAPDNKAHENPRKPGIDDAAFSRELEGLLPTLRSFAQRLCRQRELAEDMVQETMLKAWRSRANFIPGTNLRAWTFTILRNSFLSEIRKTRHTGQLDDENLPPILSAPQAQEAPLHLDDLSRAMATLPEERRRAVMLVAVEGLSYQDAADRCGCALGTIKSRVARGRAAICAWFEGRPEF